MEEDKVVCSGGLRRCVIFVFVGVSYIVVFFCKEFFFYFSVFVCEKGFFF